MAYAATTTVSPEKSRQEIERLLTKNKCSSHQIGVDHEKNRAVVQFKAHGRFVRFEISMPTRPTVASTVLSGRRMLARAEQTERQRWRALLLVIKAKFEAVDSGVTVFDEEFLAHIVTPDGSTVGRDVLPLLAGMYESGRMPDTWPTNRMLPASGETGA